MKKFILISVSVSLFFIVSSTNLFSQQKNFILGLQGGVFLPSSDLIYGYQAISFDDGSPYGLFAYGFGSGANLNIRFQYYPTNLGIHFDGGICILSREITMSLAPNGEEVKYENTLNLFPIELGLVYRFIMESNKVVPYYSAGICSYYGIMDRKYQQFNSPEEYFQGNAFSIGLYHALGMYVAIYHDLLFNAEIKMNYASGTWELEDQAENASESIQYDKLNTGGTAFKLGLAFRF